MNATNAWKACSLIDRAAETMGPVAESYINSPLIYNTMGRHYNALVALRTGIGHYAGIQASSEDTIENLGATNRWLSEMTDQL